MYAVGSNSNKQKVSFVETQFNFKQRHRCIDGRPTEEIDFGPMMPGGTVFPILVEAVMANRDFDSSAVERGYKELGRSGFYELGVHRGHHKDPEKGLSDCAFVDKLVSVFRNAQEKRDDITKMAGFVYEQGRISGHSIPWTYELISNYEVTRITITGEALIRKSEENGAKAVHLDGEHKEKVAFVNMKPGITLDTSQSNQEGKEAFNLDLLPAIAEASWLRSRDYSVPKIKFASEMDISLILYLATLDTLGKSALPVVLYGLQR